MAHTVMPRVHASCKTPSTTTRSPLQHQASLAPSPEVSLCALPQTDESPQQDDRPDLDARPQVSSGALAGTTLSNVPEGRTSSPDASCGLERMPLAVPGSARDEHVHEGRPETTSSAPFGPVFSADEITATRWLLRVLRDMQLLLIPPEGIEAPGSMIDAGILTRLARVRVICMVDAGPFGMIVTPA